MDFKISHETTSQGGRWVTHSPDDKLEAYMSYVNGGDGIIIIDHTIVPGELSGKGLAKTLLKEAISYMRKNNIKTKPTCSFAKSQLQKNHDWHDVLDPSLL
jgi:predicted GNAT family acetyltransferase